MQHALAPGQKRFWPEAFFDRVWTSIVNGCKPRWRVHRQLWQWIGPARGGSAHLSPRRADSIGVFADSVKLERMGRVPGQGGKGLTFSSVLPRFAR